MKKCIPDYGDLFKISVFIAQCRLNNLIDYDGHGYFATVSSYDDKKQISPSMIVDDEIGIPDWATHILWFNR